MPLIMSIDRDQCVAKQVTFNPNFSFNNNDIVYDVLQRHALFFHTFILVIAVDISYYGFYIVHNFYLFFLAFAIDILL